MYMHKKFTLAGIRTTIQRSRLSNNQNLIFNDELHNPNIRINLEHRNLLTNANLAKIFNRNAKLVLDIGFGDANPLLELAIKYPEYNFIGVELYKKGIVNLINKVKQASLSNVKVIYGDIKTIIKIFDNSCIYKVQIFFPDPWPKNRHHKRRLIDINFLYTIKDKLLPKEGILHISTDSESYYNSIVKSISIVNNYKKVLYEHTYRPITKFEQKALAVGRKIWDLIYRLN